MPKPIAITMGDAAGIGPEIIARFFCETRETCFVIGDPAQMERAIRLIDAPLRVVTWQQGQPTLPGTLPVLVLDEDEAPPLPPDLAYGVLSKAAGYYAYRAILKAISLAKSGMIAAMVTAPIHKEALHAAGVPFPGHTEILAHETGIRSFGMMLVEGNLRVVLVSIHLSLRAALDEITLEGEMRSIRLAHQACLALGIARPRIAVAGLNPHAGEGGLFGDEEITTIAPAVVVMREEGFDVEGPFPPDTVFMQARRGRFDVVVAQYHDQGLIPVKLGGIEKGVNITLGLPIIRTSVDHGTAFDIAGQGIADASSLTEAVTLARAMAARRALENL